jgi:hypothetical protein
MIPEDHKAFDVFLSYSSTDKVRVRRLARRLEASGLRVWFDEWIIKPGDDIYLSVERGLSSARILVLCMSQATFGSEWIALERSTALFRDPCNLERPSFPSYSLNVISRTHLDDFGASIIVERVAPHSSNSWSHASRASFVSKSQVQHQSVS